MRGIRPPTEPKRRRWREVTTVAQQLGSQAAWCDAQPPPHPSVQAFGLGRGSYGSRPSNQTPRKTLLPRLIQLGPPAAPRAPT